MKKLSLLILIALLVAALAVSCGKDNDGDVSGDDVKAVETIDISSLELSEYVSLAKYSGMTVNYDSSKTSKGDAVWDKVVEASEIKAYPEEQLEYYFEQTKAKYKYLARKGNESYENMLAALGITEEDMMNEAKRLVAEDLVLYALIEAEGVELSEAEKQNNLERYIQKFVDAYGYDEEYVRENMTEQIYDTMLFDKLLEKLIIMNEFADVTAMGGQ